jgi:Dopey, N-terminal
MVCYSFLFLLLLIYQCIDITEVVGKDIGLMIRAFAAALEDENLLVRRGALDLLLQSMRVDSTAIRKAQPDDRAILMRAATGVVLRRDLSLNRRLYTWLLGPDEKSDNQIVYLKEHALELLRSTLQASSSFCTHISVTLTFCSERNDVAVRRIFRIKTI